jgi:uncharacterized Zn finger protein (UPF0148 family)
MTDRKCRQCDRPLPQKRKNYCSAKCQRRAKYVRDPEKDRARSRAYHAAHREARNEQKRRLRTERAGKLEQGEASAVGGFSIALEVHVDDATLELFESPDEQMRKDGTRH